MKRSIYFIWVLTVLLVVTSCGNDSDKEAKEEDPDKKLPQGVITYSIEYPEIDKDNIFYAVLPKTMTMTYLGNMYKTEVQKKGMFNTTLISDNDAHELVAIFSMGRRDRYFAEMSKAEVDEFLEEFPELDYLDSDDTDSLLNVQCKHTLAIFNDISKEININYTHDLGIENPNWCNPYKKINGVLLNYDLEYYGVLLSFKATEINRDTVISRDIFSIPEDHKKVPYKKIKDELSKLFDQVK